MSTITHHFKARINQNLDGKLLSTVIMPHTEITAAYLYGSFAEGVANRRSDVDIALLLECSLNRRNILEYRMELGEQLRQALRREVDVLVLNEAPLLLQFQAIKGREILFERDPEKRALLEMQVISRFYDYRRFFDLHARQLRNA